MHGPKVKKLKLAPRETRSPTDWVTRFNIKWPNASRWWHCMKGAAATFWPLTYAWYNATKHTGQSDLGHAARMELVGGRSCEAAASHVEG